MRPKLEFWFEFASTYSYIAAQEIEDKASAASVERDVDRLCRRKACVLKEILRDLALDEEAIFERANEDSVKQLLRSRTDEAQTRGVFGAPSFFVKKELFWGSDRLEQALESLK